MTICYIMAAQLHIFRETRMWKHSI